MLIIPDTLSKRPGEALSELVIRLHLLVIYFSLSGPKSGCSADPTTAAARAPAPQVSHRGTTLKPECLAPSIRRRVWSSPGSRSGTCVHRVVLVRRASCEFLASVSASVNPPAARKSPGRNPGAQVSGL
ncbi:hypothetical protein HPB47_025648 [Ixodes persulcatus]|uniref:Uncharacterized protein n=1 Tax=Ixodes persulcatus TaxID=34615 RepID=A0AC60Q0X4_IXOPE|nr:hypothetical protein HPB47_025648 [Ixodes persulcatus]